VQARESAGPQEHTAAEDEEEDDHHRPTGTDEHRGVAQEAQRAQQQPQEVVPASARRAGTQAEEQGDRGDQQPRGQEQPAQPLPEEENDDQPGEAPGDPSSGPEQLHPTPLQTRGCPTAARGPILGERVDRPRPVVERWGQEAGPSGRSGARYSPNRARLREPRRRGSQVASAVTATASTSDRPPVSR